MTEEKKSISTVTPIKKSMSHQEKEKASKVSIKEDRFKSYDTIFNGREVLVHYDEKTGDVIIDGKLYRTNLEELPGYFLVNVQKEHNYKIEMIDGKIYLEGRRIEFTYNPSSPKLERKKSVREGETVLKAPLPGNVVEINVKVGDQVQVGQKVLTLEAMKMQNDILSDAKGVVTEISVTEGELVGTDQILIKIFSKKE